MSYRTPDTKMSRDSRPWNRSRKNNLSILQKLSTMINDHHRRLFSCRRLDWQSPLKNFGSYTLRRKKISAHGWVWWANTTSVSMRSQITASLENSPLQLLQLEQKLKLWEKTKVMPMKAMVKMIWSCSQVVRIWESRLQAFRFLVRASRRLK